MSGRIIKHGNFLVHYASKYYDPVEAHKELKTKNSRSISGFSGTQKEVFSRINDKHGEDNSKISSTQMGTGQKTLTEQSVHETLRQQDKIAATKAQIMAKINSKLESMSPTEKAELSNKLQTTVSKIRETYSDKFKELKTSYKAKTNAVNSKYENRPEGISKSLANEREVGKFAYPQDEGLAEY